MRGVPNRIVWRDRRGVALIEFAIALPPVLLLSLAGAELTNYVTVKMRVSQIALQIADNAARMGTGSVTQAKQVSETDINDVFAGAQLESGGLDLKANGRVILSDLETQTSGSTTTYRIMWQRCYGSRAQASLYGNVGDTKASGMGPAGREVIPQDATPVMFVQVFYTYRPLFWGRLIPQASRDKMSNFNEIASMAVRDRRDLTRIYNTANAPVSSC